ncbi:MAG: 50S ribosomal protein L15e [Candidatus Micrarchaeota archaeon]|nr:50S ribosomal protein L15e [Candidatus Micrarchaeota archaeon]
MSMYNSMKTTFRSEYKERSDVYKARITKWNSEAPIFRVEKPTNIARARELGYKAKQGVIIVRVQVRKGTAKRHAPAGGRKPSKAGRFYSYAKSSQAVAEERAARKFINCEVLNSYFVGDSGSKKFYEVILIDRESPVIQSTPEYMQVLSQKNRVFRGLTYAGRSHRGITRKGFGTETLRPSVRQNRRG